MLLSVTLDIAHININIDNTLTLTTISLKNTFQHCRIPLALKSTISIALLAMAPKGKKARCTSPVPVKAEKLEGTGSEGPDKGELANGPKGPPKIPASGMAKVYSRISYLNKIGSPSAMAEYNAKNAQGHIATLTVFYIVM